MGIYLAGLYIPWFCPQKIEAPFLEKTVSSPRSYPSFQISVSSNMSFRSSASSSLPDKLRILLDMREENHPCPADVARALASIAYFQAKPSLPTSRFANLERRTDDWRSSSGRVENNYADRRPAKTDDGFEVWNGNRRRGQRMDGRPEQRFQQAQPQVKASEKPEPNRVEVLVSPEPVDSVAKFSSAGVKASVTVEDRMLARIKGKINKIGASTYEATKVFMQQILDSEETGFLDEFMKFVFSKAATESAFCALYAKLLHELADEFTHLRTIMVSLFRDYIEIFTEVEITPDVGTSDYLGFVEAQERKKFRRGYSQFVSELVKLGEADVGDFAKLVQQIVGVIESNHQNPTKTLLCEEYIDCLANLCNSAPAILKAANWSEDVRQRLDLLAKKPRADVPGLTNKGRFALMDLVDSASRGWK